VDITTFYPAVKKRGYSITIAIVYVIARASNVIPEFRHRIRDGKVIEHDIVNPAFTILVKEDVFSFCSVDYVEDFSTFAANAAERIAFVKENPWVHKVPQDDLLYLTAIPWVSFTSFLHPMQLQPVDSIPRFAWGKFFEEGNLLKMPLGVQGHHALIDGVHVGKFYAEVQKYLQQSESVLGEA
jgi:chloramphenicol O-acetyltransferase type A